MSKFVPITPGGSPLLHLTAKTEELAWKNLLHEATHMPYKTVKDFKKRGYTVENWGNAKT
jgi:hypothetical protein